MTAQQEFISELYGYLLNDDLNSFSTLLQTLPQLSLNEFIAGQNNKTLLFVCAELAKTEFAKALLAHSEIDVNKGCGKFSNSALIIAAAQNNAAIVELLLDHPEIEVNQVNSHGETAFIEAAFNGADVTTKILINDRRTDVAIRTNENKSVLSEVLLKDKVSKEILRILIQHPEIDVNEMILDHNLNNNYIASPVLHLIASEYPNSLFELLQRDDLEIDQIDEEEQEIAFRRTLNENNILSARLLLLKYQHLNPEDPDISRTKVNEGLENTLQLIVDENPNTTPQEIEALQNTERQMAENDIMQIKSDPQFLATLEIIKAIKQEGQWIPFSSIGKFFELFNSPLNEFASLSLREKTKMPAADLVKITNILQGRTDLITAYKPDLETPEKYLKELNKLAHRFDDLAIKAYKKILNTIENFPEYGLEQDGKLLNEEGYKFLKMIQSAFYDYSQNKTSVHPILQEDRRWFIDFLEENYVLVEEYEEQQREQGLPLIEELSNLEVEEVETSQLENEISKDEILTEENRARKKIKLDDESKSPSSRLSPSNIEDATGKKTRFH